MYDLRSDDEGLETLLGLEELLGLETLLGLVLLPDGRTLLLDGLLLFVATPADEGLLLFDICNPPMWSMATISLRESTLFIVIQELSFVRLTPLTIRF